MPLTRRLAEALKGVDDPLLNTLRKVMYVEKKLAMLDSDFLEWAFNDATVKSGVLELTTSGSGSIPSLIRSPGDLDICMYGGRNYDHIRAEIGMGRVCNQIAHHAGSYVLETGIREIKSTSNKTAKQRERALRRSRKWQYTMGAEYNRSERLGL